MTKTLTAGLAVLSLGLFAAGCGGSDNKKSSDSESESASTACKASALKGASGLPAAFPIPGELTLTKTTKDGPTVVVDGYWTAGVKEAHDEYLDQVKQAGYKVLFNELEEHDSEISYSGSGKTGQIALRGDCTEGSDVTRVHITNRPA